MVIQSLPVNLPFLILTSLVVTRSVANVPSADAHEPVVDLSLAADAGVAVARPRLSATQAVSTAALVFLRMCMVCLVSL